MRATYTKLVVPCLAEGFDELYRVRCELDGFVVEEWMDAVR